MEGVAFVLDEPGPDSLHLCILYIASHMVLTHHLTLASAFELVAAQLLTNDRNEAAEAPEWLREKVYQIQCKLNDAKFPYRMIRIEKHAGLLAEYDVRAEIAMLMNTHANA